MAKQEKVLIRERITRHVKGVMLLCEEALLMVPDDTSLVDALKGLAVQSRRVLIEVRKEETAT